MESPLRIFINYRRSDTAAIALRLRGFLKERLRAEVFVDETGIRLGTYPEQLEEALRASAAVLMLVGPRWKETLRARRSAEEEDWVVRELDAALRSSKVIVPVLVDGVEPLTARDLPPGIQAVARFQAVPLRPQQENEDAELLALRIERDIAAGGLRDREFERAGLGRILKFQRRLGEHLARQAVDLRQLLLTNGSFNRLDWTARVSNDGTAPAWVARALDLFRILRELSDDDWQLVSRLAAHPTHSSFLNRLAGKQLEWEANRGTFDTRTLELAWRVLEAALLVQELHGARLTDRLGASRSHVVTRPTEATELLASLDESHQSISVRWAGAGRLWPLGKFVARAHPLRHVQLRVAPGEEPKLYACDDRAIYRWSLSNARPEMDWPIPADNFATTFRSLQVFSSESVEFLAETSAGSRWLQRPGPGGLIPLPPLASTTRSRSALGADPTTGHPRHVSAWIKLTHQPAQSAELHVEWIDPNEPSARISRLTPIHDALEMHESLLRVDGKVARLFSAYAAHPCEYRGYPVMLVECALEPRGTAFFFIDPETGSSLRTPAVSRNVLDQPRIVALKDREYLVCVAPTSREAVVQIFDVTHPSETHLARTTHHWPPAPVAEVIRNAPFVSVTLARHRAIAPPGLLVSLRSPDAQFSGIVSFMPEPRNVDLLAGHDAWTFDASWSISSDEAEILGE